MRWLFRTAALVVVVGLALGGAPAYATGSCTTNTTTGCLYVVDATSIVITVSVGGYSCTANPGEGTQFCAEMPKAHYSLYGQGTDVQGGTWNWGPADINLVGADDFTFTFNRNAQGQP